MEGSIRTAKFHKWLSHATPNKPMKKPHFFLIPGLCAITVLMGASARGASVLVPFDTSAQYSGNFNEVVAGTDGLTWSSANGAGGTSGRINVTQGASADTTAVYTPATYNLTAGGSTTISLYFLTPTTIGTNSQVTVAQVGFSEDTAQGFYSSGGQDYISARVRSFTTGTTYIMEGVFGNNGTASIVNATAAFSLTTNTWYKLSATFTDIGTSFSYAATVENYGTTGASFVSTVQSISGTQAQTSLSSSDTTAYGAFRANGTTNNKVLALDNFAIIPEPSTASLIMGALGMLALLRRRAC